MKVTGRVSMVGALRKIERAQKVIEREADNDLKEYGREFIDHMLKVTPPNNGRGNMGGAIRAAKGRVAKDFTGSATAQGRTWTDEDFRWITVHGMPKLVRRNSEQAAPTPFIAVEGRLTPAKVRAIMAQHNVGRYHVQFITEDLSGFMKSSGQYRLSGHKVRRLSWRGPRHLATAAAIRGEVKRRQMQVGRLAAGWAPTARLVRARMTGVPGRHAGEGSVVKRGRGVKKSITATNSVPYSPLGRIVKRNERRVANGVKRRGRYLAEKKRKKLRGLR